jgi:prepilin-type N-terminal cleavage/methylation domain-containing protein
VSARRRGFTLIELITAIAVTALVVLLAHQLFSTLVDAGGRARRARHTIDREANGRRLVASAFLSLDVGFDSTGGFVGEPERVRFSTWLLTADGWYERKSVVIGREESEWVLRGDAAFRVLLADSVESVGLDYLLEPGANAAWVREWVSSVSAPLAVRVRVARVGGVVDTALYLIKARG